MLDPDKPFSPTGQFIATIAGTDQNRIVPDCNKPAAFAIVIQNDYGGKITELDCQPVQADVADENEAFVLAIRHLLNFSGTRSQITLRSSSASLVNTINKYLAAWKQNQWRKSNGKAPEYLSSWMEIDRLIAEKNITIKAVRVKKAYAAKDAAFKLAKELAVGERDIHGRKIGAPLSGFSSIE